MQRTAWNSWSDDTSWPFPRPRSRAEEAKHALAATEAALARLGGKLRRAKRNAEDEGYQLEVLLKEVEAGSPMVAVHGRVLGREEVGLKVRDQRHRLELATKKVAVLEDVLARHRERKAALEPVVREAPGELARLELSLRHLKEKVRLYEEVKDLGPDGRVDGDPFAAARREVEGAHAEVDARLKAVEGSFCRERGLDDLARAGDGSAVRKVPGADR